MPATYQPPVTPNTAKCGAHPIPSHKTARKREYSRLIHSHYKSILHTDT